MRKLITLAAITSLLPLYGCVKGKNPDDPYETINRKTYVFNQKVDAAVLKPVARAYITVLPGPVRTGVNNFYDNVNMIPTVANDLLQAEFVYAYKDTWRFIINSTVGLAGLVDVATTMNLPPHTNDLGITLSKWGDKKSPYIVIPLLGPSTIRDGMGLMFNYTLFTPYPYLSSGLAWGFVGVRYVDLRSQLFETEKLMNEAIDPYAFVRDAYLQHRHYLITGEQVNNDSDSSGLYVAGDDDTRSVVPPIANQSDTSTQSKPNASHRPTSA